MLRNVPVSWSQEALFDFVDYEGFSGSYDFLFLPADLERQGNVGYAFVNFCTPHQAERCQAAFDQKALQGHSTRLEVTFATVQGLSRNIEHWRNSPISMAKEARWQPLVLINGQWEQLRGENSTCQLQHQSRVPMKENRHVRDLHPNKSVHRGGYSNRGRGRGAYFNKSEQ